MKTQRLRRKPCIQIALPEDLLIEIFLRLSVNTLICSKCVRKQWYALITIPNFALNHIQYQKSHNKGRLLLQYFKDETQQYRGALFDDETLVSGKYHDLDIFQSYQYGLKMEGPADGLYCLFYRRESIILWNPALREFRTLPLPHLHFLPHVTNDLGKIGFGLDPLTHDYKVVLIRVFCDKIRIERHPSIYVTVYNLSTNTWRLLDLGDFRLCLGHFYLSRHSSYLNGANYWWDDCGVIIAFDMCKENFREISGPQISDPTSFSGALMLYDDKIALLLSKGLFVDIWMMLEGGVWVKQFNLNSCSNCFVGFWKNDEIFLATYNSQTSFLEPKSQIVLLNNSTRELKNMGPIGVYIYVSGCLSIMKVWYQ